MVSSAQPTWRVITARLQIFPITQAAHSCGLPQPIQQPGGNIAGQPETTSQCIGDLRLADANLGCEFILRHASRPHFCSDRNRNIGWQKPMLILIQIDNGAARCDVRG